ncbi:MAG: hypothetical protein J3K34DRAFT_521072 [Monoraphidium minutum]|nr:MAG: hypothetical protein J3K34DRAFT_521072 [Monoraphidium minutum]
MRQLLELNDLVFGCEGGGLLSELRRSRAARASLARAAEERRVSRASLHVAPGNAAAAALYRGAGFAVEASVPDYYGPGCPALRMATDDVAGALRRLPPPHP